MAQSRKFDLPAHVPDDCFICLGLTYDEWLKREESNRLSAKMEADWQIVGHVDLGDSGKRTTRPR